MSYVIGVDGGTESLRAGFYDAEGRCLAAASCPYETRFSSGARAEQDPEDWWRALGVAVREAVYQSGVGADLRPAAMVVSC